MSSRAWASAAAMLTLAGVAFMGGWLADAPALTSPARSGDMPSLMAAGSHADRPERETPAPAQDADWQGAERAVYREGSLRGTDFPAWGVARGETLVPNRRFDRPLGLHDACGDREKHRSLRARSPGPRPRCAASPAGPPREGPSRRWSSGGDLHSPSIGASSTGGRSTAKPGSAIRKPFTQATSG